MRMTRFGSKLGSNLIFSIVVKSKIVYNINNGMVP